MLLLLFVFQMAHGLESTATTLRVTSPSLRPTPSSSTTSRRRTPCPRSSPTGSKCTKIDRVCRYICKIDSNQNALSSLLCERRLRQRGEQRRRKSDQTKMCPINRGGELVFRRNCIQPHRHISYFFLRSATARCRWREEIPAWRSQITARTTGTRNSSRSSKLWFSITSASSSPFSKIEIDGCQRTNNNQIKKNELEEKKSAASDQTGDDCAN